jgi:hypothetical protein
VLRNVTDACLPLRQRLDTRFDVVVGNKCLRFLGRAGSAPDMPVGRTQQRERSGAPRCRATGGGSRAAWQGRRWFGGNPRLGAGRPAERTGVGGAKRPRRQVSVPNRPPVGTRSPRRTVKEGEVACTYDERRILPAGDGSSGGQRATARSREDRGGRGEVRAPRVRRTHRTRGRVPQVETGYCTRGALGFGFGYPRRG